MIYNISITEIFQVFLFHVAYETLDVPAYIIGDGNMARTVDSGSSTPSSMIALQDHMNRYYELDASDIYNDPRENPELDTENFGSKVLKVYGL